jgi:non-specific serine/threonine protein kinase/serine/threonine-protein kinase
VGHTVRAQSLDADRLRKRLAGDLDNIVLKALSKEPDRRYASVDVFAEDVRRHLAGLPVVARKDTLGYRASKFVRRNTLVVASAAAIFLALVAGVIGTTWQARVARAERIRAEGRFDDVRRLANALLFEVHDQISELAGSTPARKLLVTRALEYLDKLARDAGDRADLRRELAAAYVRVGDVQGRPLTANLGDTAGAMASYQKAVALYESLAADERGPKSSGDASQLVRDQGIAYMRVSELQGVMGDTRRALTYARKGLALQEGVSAGAAAEARRELAASHSRVGDLSSATGDLKASIEHRRKALSLMETLAAEAPNDVGTLRQLGIAHQKLGNVLGNPNAPNVGDYQAALAEFDRAAAVFGQASAASPTNAQIRRNVAVVDSNMSDVLVALKRPADALARMQQAFETFHALSTADPANAAARNDFAIAQSKMGEMLDGEGRSVEALREYQQALAIHESLARADSANDALRAELASGNNRVATVQAKLGDRSGSLAHHARAIAISRELAAANPGDVELSVALALALNGRGDAFAAFARRGVPGGSRSDDLAAAVRDYTEGVALLEKLQAEGAIAGSDLDTLNAAKAELAKLSTESGALHGSH